MNLLEWSALLNFSLALYGTYLYIRNGLRCESSWKYLKLAIAFNIGIVAFLYGLMILHVYVDPLAVRLNTTLLLVLLVISGILGRSKYGNRN